MQATAGHAPTPRFDGAMADSPDIPSTVRESPPAREAGSAWPADRRRAPLVLVIDDEPPIVELLAVLFEEEGFIVLSAYDGAEGLRLAEERQPDLVISDVSMPRLSGIDLVRRLRDDGREVPVILMSAVVRHVPADGVVFVPKPFDLDEMLELAIDRLRG